MEEKRADKTYSTMVVILTVVILFFPLLAGQIIAIILILFGIALLCSFLIFAVMGIGEILAGVAMIGVGIEKLFTMPMGAIAVMGFGLANIGVALLLECFVLWIYGVAMPTLFRKIRGKEVKDEETS
ncbi:MAG: hypothetical protein IJZ42_12360 [Lachnospiraceae bacterium]|nr:hypothetical protein [Lachnospiraceae bacterium]